MLDRLYPCMFSHIHVSILMKLLDLLHHFPSQCITFFFEGNLNVLHLSLLSVHFRAHRDLRALDLCTELLPV